MTRAERIRELLDEYARRRRQNEEEQRQREREAFDRDPRLEQLREESIALAVRAMREAMREKDEQKRRAIAEQMRESGLRINAEMRTRLRNLGLAQDYLEERYRCNVCRDTGYVGDAPARFCECFERRLAAMGAQDAIAEQTFERFDPGLIPEEGGQRSRMLEARDALEDFANRFPDVRRRSVVLMGAGGLGKSFLLNCVYERVIRREHAALRTTAFRMFEAMRRRHIGGGDAGDAFCEMLRTPLLLIDDLGTEPMMNNITVEYLFLLVNERMEGALPTLVTTNLNQQQLRERYGERVFSRLFDRSRTLAIKLEGRDLRLYGNR